MFRCDEQTATTRPYLTSAKGDPGIRGLDLQGICPKGRGTASIPASSIGQPLLTSLPEYVICPSTYAVHRFHSFMRLLFIHMSLCFDEQKCRSCDVFTYVNAIFGIHEWDYLCLFLRCVTMMMKFGLFLFLFFVSFCSFFYLYFTGKIYGICNCLG